VIVERLGKQGDEIRRSMVGEWVLIHVGFAMSRINAQQAAETLRILTELGETQAELESIRTSDAELSATG
jgi:hydrogenase expression/formation protein HypC